ncbi:MAG: hypothetical protein CVV42_14310 [Candidatus Riflebacteria bacterium HGW-Riflebacteria-2]|jgi:hypothetical protein|nr:MAG: hypothetical protein CVV42_14310 [Candidatus Riflebacteria bacterium HGW-Riflebacteria-2]
MNNSLIATAVPLCRVKLRIFINTLKAKFTGKKAVLVFCAAIFLIVTIGSAVSDLFAMVDGIVGQKVLLVEWAVGFLALYAIMIVFVSDLLTGHTINAGQMSSDFDYLTTLPVSPASLFCVKTFERVASDYIGAMILLSAFLTATCRNGISLTAIILSLLLFIQISVLVGTVINLVMLTLRRYLPVSSINNFFSFFGYLAGFAIFIPYLLISQANGPAGYYVSDFIMQHQDAIFALKPVRWLGATIYHARFITEFWQFSGLWLAAMLFCGMLLYRALDAGALAIRKTRSNRRQQRQPGRFSGLAQKDYLLLQSDYNIRVNALLMPVSLILLNILITREAFELMSFNAGLNMIFAGVIYFCMFGPTNAIGSEGRTIALLETLPLHPQQILLRKFTFWLTVSSVVFLPLAAGTAWFMEFDLADALRLVLMTFLLTGASVWAALQFSAIFPIFDSKMLQQSSSFWAKAGGFFLLLMLIPLKEFSLLNFYSLLIFVLIVLILNMKARLLLFYRTETGQHAGPRQEWFNFLLLALAFIGAEATIKQFFLAIVPGVDTGFWSWVLPLLFVTPIMLLTAILGRRREKADAVSQTRPAWQAVTATAVFSAVGAWISWAFISRTPEFRLLLRREFVYFAELIEETSLSFDISAFIVGAILVIFAGLATLLTARIAGRCLAAAQHLQAIAIFAVLPALALSQMIVPALILSIMAALYCRFFTNPVGAAFIAVISTAIPAILLLN